LSAMKKQHRYRITIEHTASPEGELNPAPTLSFEAGNHDDILAMVPRAAARTGFDADTSAAFAVGLKLFSEVMLENRQHPLFQEFSVHFGQFMKQLKQGR